MRGRDKRRTAEALLAFLTCLFCGLLLLSYGGCTEGEAEAPNIDGVNAATIQKGEAQLLQEVAEKFENPDAHFQLGQIYARESRWAKAEYHYNVALRFDPAHKPSQAAMVKMLIDSGDTTKAQQYVDEYMEQASTSATESVRLAEAFDKQGLDQRAVACFEQALRLSPNSPEVNKRIGYYYLRKDDEARAKEYLTRSFQTNPNQPDVASELGRLGVVVKVPRVPGQRPDNLGPPDTQ
jgi:Tfp pilus assembly protein PilF